MFKKLAKLKYLPNNFEVIQNSSCNDVQFLEKKYYLRI